VLAAPLPENMDRELIHRGRLLHRRHLRHPRAPRRRASDIRLYKHPVNQGKGAAVRTAIDYAVGDFSLIQDADLEYDSSEYPILLKPLLDGRADAVFGFALPGGRARNACCSSGIR